MPSKEVSHSPSIQKITQHNQPIPPPPTPPSLPISFLHPCLPDFSKSLSGAFSSLHCLEFNSCSNSLPTNINIHNNSPIKIDYPRPKYSPLLAPLHTSTYKNEQTHKRTNTHTDTQTHRHTDIQTHRQTHRHTVRKIIMIY